jgi:vitamin B12 transporter
VSRFKYALAALALLPTSSFAQTDDCDKDNSCIIIADPIRPDLIVVTANGSSTPLWEVGQAITVLTNQAIADRQSTSVADLLSTTPGITVSRNGGPGQTTAVRIRGAEDAQTLVLIDGVRVNDPSSPGGAFDFGNLLTGNIDRIEVLRGPNSVPWGSQAIGGVVNIVTAQLEGARLSAQYGFKNAKQIVGQAGGRVGPITASLGGGYFNDDGISAFRGGTERDGYRQYAANARIGVEISDAVSIDLRGYFADSRVSFDGYPPPNFSFGDTAEFAKTRQIFGYAGLNATLLGVKSRLAFTVSDTARDSFDPAFGAAPSFISRGRTARFEYQGDADITDTIRAVFGVEHETSRFRDDFSRYSTGVTSGYVQAIVQPADSLTLTGGLRIDDHKTYGTKITASANAAWSIGSGTILRASYGEGFKAPTLFQLFSDFGNPGIKPETAQSYDASLEQSLIGGTLKFGVTAFHRDTRNQIDFFSCFGSTNPLCATRPFGFYDNIARTRTQGIEAFIELRPTSTLAVAANYSLIDARNRATGRALIRRPEHSVNVTIDWAARDWLKLAASVQNVSDSVDGFGGTIRLDGYTLAGLRAAVPIGDRVELYGRIENLFDASYETVSGYGTLGRNAHVGVRAKF